MFAYSSSNLGAINKRRPQNSGIFTHSPVSIYVYFFQILLLVDVHFIWPHFNTVSVSWDQYL